MIFYIFFVKESMLFKEELNVEKLIYKYK